MNILGISAYYHDSAACIIKDGQIIAAVQEERFTRIKNDPSFPEQAVKYCLDEAGLTLKDIDYVCYYEKPLLKFERLIYTFLDQAPKGYRNFLKSMPIWIKQKLMLRNVIKKELKHLYPKEKRKFKILFPEHHLSHAASAYYPSGFSESAILTIDGVGEWDTSCIYKAKGSTIEKIKSIRYPDSIGLLYSAFTSYLGFKVNSGEYKMMGLAPYGNENSDQTQGYIKKIKEHLVSIKQDGSFKLNQKYFDYLTGKRMYKTDLWNELFDLDPRPPNAEIKQVHCNLAKAIQIVTEEIVLDLAKHALKIADSKNLCLAGGVALNCVANGKVHELPELNSLFIQPAAGDAGGALGAALAGLYSLESDRKYDENAHLNNSLLGPSYTQKEILEALAEKKLIYNQIEESELYESTAKLIADGKAIGWFQGRSEFGPRALGNRSIIADPRNTEMQSKLNLKIKNRESFRPFAPAVLEEDVHKHFEMDSPSPFMLLVKQVKSSELNDITADYDDLALRDKLSYTKSNLPAITHVDFSARIQTVTKSSNPRFYKLIKAFKEITGFGVLVNTSFNKKDEPIVNSPADAINCFLDTGMDCLILGNYLIRKDGLS